MEKGRQDKLQRVQGHRSSKGCQTCKHPNPPPTPTKFVAFTLTKTPAPALQLPPYERRTLHHFQSRTLHQIQGPFKSDFWSVIVPQLVQHDAIVRYAVFALSQMHEHYLDQAFAVSSSINYALHYYQKALRQIVRLKSPDASFDSILIACMVFCVFESLRGGFDEATQHAVAGVNIIASRKSAGSSRDSTSAISNDILLQLCLLLQGQVMEANSDEYRTWHPDLLKNLDVIPATFASVEHALPYLQIISYQVIHLFDIAETHHKTETWIPSSVSPMLLAEYTTLRTNFDAWSRAASQIESIVRNESGDQYQGYLILQIFRASLKIDLEVFVHGETVYDDFKADNFGILKLVEVLFQVQGGSDRPRDPISPQTGAYSLSRAAAPFTFTSTLGIVSLLFEIATRTNDSMLRNEALQLMRLSNRREGIWDSRVAALLAEKVVLLKQRGNAAAEEDQHSGFRFIVTDIQLLSDQKCKLTYGFKRNQPGTFKSFWLESIAPEEGSLQTEVIEIS
ncbi:uncharacterized protein HMPREF1541_10572 [Cyphellophora europaea CBS 101466]|uniref:Transcription factor domain-containing protein n=1 Tax=Cyphellophora europaea (strain CBS 101466) TaxID=1220924 RepID=W2S6V3_CYPE1|nr:uncharacterized protein HMPREF1541_10572 [Cyphellophora europaea CBS 101466]ETN44392.1 hypothetical protein HMPREF1541_10572 [Cyphellophora europaea CBS 101466]